MCSHDIRPPRDLTRFALDFYDWPSVASALLTLQDQAAQQIPVILAFVYADWTGRLVNPDQTVAAQALSTAWHQSVIWPLRKMRQSLKNHVEFVSDEDRLILRAHVKTLELEAERRLLDQLDSLIAAAPPEPGRRTNFDRYCSEAGLFRPSEISTAVQIIRQAQAQYDGRDRHSPPSGASSPP